MGEKPLFLERRRYRARRVMDLVRLLPFLCALLWVLIPLMWPRGDGLEGTALSSALSFVFAIWMLAIAACFALWGRTRSEAEPTD